ncbi:MAG: peptide-binding protein [Candidatus Saganbacteria bacterium]|nr:peptide-binding protein [Candidatus Saganbacteria bacterium]
MKTAVKAIFILILLGILGCRQTTSLCENNTAANDGKTKIDKNGTLVFCLGGEISILNPVLSSDSSSSAVEGPIYSGLTKVNERLEIIPDLARKWTVSKDGRVYIFYLRDDVLWHDGKKFTAQDVKFTFNSILDPKVNSVRRGDYMIDGKPIKFNVAGPYIMQAILPKPFAPFLASMGMGILPGHILRGKDINSASFNQHPVGTGPFIFKEWVSGDHVTLVRNEKYYGGSPLLSSVLFKIIPDENSRLIALEAGEVDESDIPPKDYSRIKKMPGVNVFEYDSLTYTYLGLNLTNPLFKDKKVRQALAYATDKSQLADLIFRGLAAPAYSPSAPVSWVYENNVNKYRYDLKKAERLLNEAGWKYADDGKRRMKNGKLLEFTILVNQGNKEREKAAVVLQWQYKKIGVKVDIRVMEWSALLKIINSPKDPKNFDSVIIGWSLGIDPDSYSIWHSSQYPSGLNFIKYNNKEVDRLLELGRVTVAKEKRKEIYQKLQRIIADDQPYIFLWYPKSVVAVSNRVGGLSKPGPAGLFLNIEKVFVRNK